MSLAFVFPGQGSQYVGMGADLVERYEIARQTFEEAEEVLERPLRKLCFEGPKEELDQTINTQPAIFTLEVALLRVLQAEGALPAPQRVAGHSLGEYAALVASGALTFADGLKLVRRRAELMQEAGERTPGRMVAVVGLSVEAVREALQEIEGVWPVNENTPTQVVIAGTPEGVEQAQNILRERGARRLVPLAVSLACHTPLLDPVTAAWHEAVDALPDRWASIPIVNNVTATSAIAPSDWKAALKQHLTSPVRWVDSVQHMRELGIELFVEIGPGQVLSGLLSKIDRAITVWQAGTADEVESVRDQLRLQRSTPPDLEGKVAVVTGASRGIGRAIAIELGRRGATVVVNYRGNQAAAEETVEAVRRAGGIAHAVQADVSRAEEARALIKTAQERFGQIDILVNNAGITRDDLLIRMKEEDWHAVLETNLSGAFYCTQAVARDMMRRRSGRIINIASVAGVMGNPGQSNYSAAKAGLIGLTKSAARELASRGVTVNVVAPGLVETDMTAVLPEEIKQNLIKLTPMGRMATPEEIAKAVAFLASDDASYITGHVLTVDGGMAM